MPVEWHRTMLARREEWVRSEEANLARQHDQLMRARFFRDLLLRQITEAERRGKTEFDADRYLVKRAKKDAAE